jgi:alpha-glucosidase
VLGTWTALPAPEGLLAFRRRHAGDERTVVVSFRDETVAWSLAGAWEVAIASDGAGEGAPYSGQVGPEQALVLRPR